MTEAAILAAVLPALVQLLENLEGAPSQAQLEKTIRDALVAASDAAAKAEFPGEKP